MTETPRPDDRVPMRGAITDRRTPPTGVLPRQLQTWLMVGIAVVVLLIILITGRREPPMPPGSTTTRAPITLAPADRIRTYQQQLAAEEARQQQALTGGRAPANADDPRAGSRASVAASSVRASGQDAAESLRADNVALSHRATGPSSYAERNLRREVPNPTEVPASPDLGSFEQALTRALAARPSPTGPRAEGSALATTAENAPITEPSAAASSAASKQSRAATATEHPAPGERFTLFEGTVIETALLNRLDGTFAGPVVCLVTTPVYAQDRQRVLIPQGARVLGGSSSVQGWGDSRLAVSFHRLLMPDGHTYSLDLFKGLDQVGETGVRDAVNRHYAQVFGASIAIGALSGLAQYNTRSGAVGVTDFGDEFRQSAGASIAGSATRILDRYLNVLPTLTIREGHRIKVYLTNDMALPAFVPGAPGGVR